MLKPDNIKEWGRVGLMDDGRFSIQDFYFMGQFILDSNVFLLMVESQWDADETGLDPIECYRMNYELQQLWA